MSQISIGEIAKQFGLSTQAIRYYEKLGIIESPQRSEKGYRLYDNEAVKRLTLIQYAQSFGLSLNQIKELLTQEKKVNAPIITLKNMVDNHIKDLEKQLKQISNTHQELSKKLEQLNQIIPPQKNEILESIDRSLLVLFEEIESNLSASKQTATLNKANRLLQHYSSGERNFQSIELIGAQLNGAFLCDADFSYAEMMLASLNEASLANSKLHRAYLSGADLIGAYLKQTELIGAELIGADLTEADLTEANLTGCNLGGANLAGANLTGANLSEAVLIGANLEDADFTDAILLGCNLADSNYSSLREL